MIASLVATLATFSLLGHSLTSPIPLPKPEPILASHQFSLDQRYDNKPVNDVFKDNILLNIAYMQGSVKPGDQISWGQVRTPFEYSFRLHPNQTFAFHDDVLEKYSGKVEITTGAHFNWQEGFKSDGYLVGDGVCHLASLMYWTAKDAGLSAEAPTNHDFMPINQIPKAYGVAIYDVPGQKDASAHQNLYITNNKDKPVDFKFAYAGNILKVTIVEE